ncbi:MAG: hypothetical protein V7604_80, partial [Hyphomicrobiales bacterium]
VVGETLAHLDLLGRRAQRIFNAAGRSRRRPQPDRRKAGARRELDQLERRHIELAEVREGERDRCGDSRHGGQTIVSDNAGRSANFAVTVCSLRTGVGSESDPVSTQVPRGSVTPRARKSERVSATITTGSRR